MVYKFRRLRALMLGLSVTKSSRLQRSLRWLWVILGYVVTICFALAEVLKTSHDWPISWRDISALDATARSFLMSSYVALTTGFYAATAMTYSFKGASAKIVPPPAMATALRNVARNRDTRYVNIIQMEQPALGVAAEETDDASTLSLVVATPELLTRPFPLVLVVIVSGVICLALAAALASFLSLEFTPPYFLGAAGVYSDLRFIGVLVAVSAVTFASAWRMWNSWRARSRGAEVKVAADGLTIRDSETLWRPRFIPWRDAQSLVRFTYNDTYVRACTVYLLDAGNQTFLWESPPDMRYASPARRAKIAERQASAARLLALTASATSLPLLDISGAVNTVAKVEPERVYEPPSDNEPGAKDMALLESFEAPADAREATLIAPPPTRSEQWLRLRGSLLVWCAGMIAAAWLAQGIVH